MDKLATVGEVLGCGAVGAFMGWWCGMLTDPEGAMSISAGFSALTGAVVGGVVGVAVGVVVFA